MVEIVLDGYWQTDMSQRKRDGVLMDWCDELEEWPVESVKAALRQWRRENPSKKPNPGHVLQILNRAWGERNAAHVRKTMNAQAEGHRPMTADEHAALSADLAARFPGLIKRIPEVRHD